MEDTTVENNQNQTVQSPDSFSPSDKTINKDNELKLKLKAQEARIKELETYKQDIETRKLKDQLYKKYMYSETERSTVDNLLQKYNIKDFQTFIEDFYKITNKNTKTKASDDFFNRNNSDDDTLDLAAKLVLK